MLQRIKTNTATKNDSVRQSDANTPHQLRGRWEATESECQLDTLTSSRDNQCDCICISYEKLDKMDANISIICNGRICVRMNAKKNRISLLRPVCWPRNEATIKNVHFPNECECSLSTAAIALRSSTWVVLNYVFVHAQCVWVHYKQQPCTRNNFNVTAIESDIFADKPTRWHGLCAQISARIWFSLLVLACARVYMTALISVNHPLHLRAISIDTHTVLTELCHLNGSQNSIYLCQDSRCVSSTSISSFRSDATSIGRRQWTVQVQYERSKKQNRNTLQCTIVADLNTLLGTCTYACMLIILSICAQLRRTGHTATELSAI